MEKVSTILFVIWMILAVVSFVVSFWAPLFFKVLGLVFGGFNIFIILSWIVTYRQGLKEKKALADEITKLVEDELNLKEE